MSVDGTDRLCRSARKHFRCLRLTGSAAVRLILLSLTLKRLWQPSDVVFLLRCWPLHCWVDYIQSLREGGVIKLLPRNNSAIRRPSFKIGYSMVEAVRLEKTKRLSRLNQDTRLDKHPRT